MMLHELSTFPAHDQSYPTAALMSVASTEPTWWRGPPIVCYLVCRRPNACDPQRQ